MLGERVGPMRSKSLSETLDELLALASNITWSLVEVLLSFMMLCMGR